MHLMFAEKNSKENIIATLIYMYTYMAIHNTPII